MGQAIENTKVMMGQHSTAIQDKMNEMGKQKEEKAVGKEEIVATEEKANETVMGGANRQSTDAPVVNTRPATKRKLGGTFSNSSGQWYLEHDSEELAGVTGEKTNLDLGIKLIQVFAPSDKQWSNGTVANVTLKTVVGLIKGIQVRESNRDESGSLYMQTQSRSWEKDGQKQYMNDIELDRKVEAQILSYVDDLLVPAEEAK